MESQFIKKIKNLYFWFCMIYITGATFLVEIDWLLIPVTLLGYYCFYMKNLKWDKFIGYVILGYSVISFGSYIFNGDAEFSLPAFIGYYFRILIPYFLIKVFGFSLFDKFEKVVYYGALLSLPFFIILIIDPYFYTKYLSSINMSGELRTSVGYWNCFLYTTHGGDNELRNDGFAIEPGHFGYLLGIAIFFNLVLNNFKLNNRLIIMVIAGLTTLSTTFYLSLGLLLYLYSLNNKLSSYIKLFVFIIVLLVGWKIANSNLVINKINKTNESTEEQFQYGYNKIEYGESMNRFGALQIEIMNFRNYPLGHSINNTGLIHAADGEVVVGPNGLATIISFWGICGMFFLYYSLKKFSSMVKNKFELKKGIYVFPIIFLMYLFSNSISRDILVFAILFYPYIMHRTISKNNQHNRGKQFVIN